MMRKSCLYDQRYRASVKKEQVIAVDTEELITIIVPVYNMELYLDDCIQSILNQSYAYFEVILVDDCSTDNSGAICDSYAGKDSRIRVIHKNKNEGLSSARNTGVEMAVGRYVCFVDSDDCILSDYLSILYKNAVLFGADISWCSFEKFENVLPSDKSAENRPKQVSKQKLYEYLTENHKKPEFVVSWNKLIRKELACRLTFPIGRWHEDEFYINDLVEHAGLAVETETRLYCYRQRKNSITGSDNAYDIRHLDILDAVEERVRRCRHMNRRIYHRSLVSYRGAIISEFHTFSKGTIAVGLKIRLLMSFFKYPAADLTGMRCWILFIFNSKKFYEKYWG